MRFCVGKAFIRLIWPNGASSANMERFMVRPSLGRNCLAKDEEIRRLRQALSQSRQQLQKAEAIIEVQKKVCTLFGISSESEAE